MRRLDLGSTRHRKSAYLGGCVAILALSMIWYLSRSTSRVEFECGTTISEARARNCHFEPMQRSWIPDACYFTEPAIEYDPFHDRIWYLDENFESEADPDALAAGGIEVAFVANFHQEHCTYNWRKLAIAMDERRELIDSRVGSLNHATHCALGLAEQTKNMSACPATRAGALTKSNLNFLKCVSLR